VRDDAGGRRGGAATTLAPVAAVTDRRRPWHLRATPSVTGAPAVRGQHAIVKLRADPRRVLV